MLVRAQQWVVWRCAVLKDRGGGLSPFSGGFGEGETPLPIPNRAVKPLSADGTWPARAWESRTPPVYLIARAARRGASASFRRPRFGRETPGDYAAHQTPPALTPAGSRRRRRPAPNAGC